LAIRAEMLSRPQAASPKYVGDRFDVVSIAAQAGARSGRGLLRVLLGSYCDGDVPQADPGRITLNNNLYTLITMAFGKAAVRNRSKEWEHGRLCSRPYDLRPSGYRQD
jgi:hypothetical protein